MEEEKEKDGLTQTVDELLKAVTRVSAHHETVMDMAIRTAQRGRLEEAIDLSNMADEMRDDGKDLDDFTVYLRRRLVELRATTPAFSKHLER